MDENHPPNAFLFCQKAIFLGTETLLVYLMMTCEFLSNLYSEFLMKNSDTLIAIGADDIDIWEGNRAMRKEEHSQRCEAVRKYIKMQCSKIILHLYNLQS